MEAKQAMGWMASWIAVQGASKGDLLNELGLAEGQELVEPGSGAAVFSLSERSDGWLIVFSEDYDWAAGDDVAEMSRLGLMVGCQINDKVDMDSAAWAARDGREIWRVAYRSTFKGHRLESSGSPPPEFASIRSAALREQEEAGDEGARVAYLFEVPLDVASAACGYRMDVDPSCFVRLERSRSAAAPAEMRAPGWLARLFGGRKGRA